MGTRIEGKEGAWTGRERAVEGAGEQRYETERGRKRFRESFSSGSAPCQWQGTRVLVFHRAGQYQTWPDAQPPRWTNRLTPRKNALSWPPRCHVQTLFVPGQKRKRATTSLSTHAELCFRSSYASLSLSYRSPMSFFIRCCFRRSVFIVRSLLASVYFSCNLSPLMMTGK